MSKHICRLMLASKFARNANTKYMPRLNYSNAQLPKPPAKQPMITWKIVGYMGIGSAVALGLLKYVQSEKDAAIEKERKRTIGKASIGGTWELLDTKGNKKTNEDFRGKWCLIYFGFSHCPDVCPDELEKMAKAIDGLAKDNIEVQPLFITVDPRRDTPEVLDKYTKEFSSKFIGLTGSTDQIASVCKKFRVYFSAGPRDEDNDYIVDHTIVLFLINPDGEFVEYFGQNKTYSQIIDQVTFFKGAFDGKNNKSWF